MAGIGTKETELIATLSDRRIRVFSVAEAAKILKITRSTASDLVLRLLKKKKNLQV